MCNVHSCTVWIDEGRIGANELMLTNINHWTIICRAIYIHVTFYVQYLHLFATQESTERYDKFRPGRTKTHRKHVKTPASELHVWSQHVSRSMSTGFRVWSACGSQIFLHAMRASFNIRFMAQQFWRCQLRAENCRCKRQSLPWNMHGTWGGSASWAAGGNIFLEVQTMETAWNSWAHLNQQGSLESLRSQTARDSHHHISTRPTGPVMHELVDAWLYDASYLSLRNACRAQDRAAAILWEKDIAETRLGSAVTIWNEVRWAAVKRGKADMNT